MINNFDLENINLSTEYRIASYLGDQDSYRFLQTIEGELKISDDMGNCIKTIGKLIGKKLLLSEAINYNLDIESIFDNESHTFEIGELIYNFADQDWSENIRDKYDDQIQENNLLILSRIEILPEYQKQGIGKKWIKDFYLNFIQGCGLMVLKVFPLQYESNHTLGRDKNWCDEMGYEKMNKNEDSFESLLQFYLKVGFEVFPDISKKYVFINPILRNKKFEKIEF